MKREERRGQTIIALHRNFGHGAAQSCGGLTVILYSAVAGVERAVAVRRGNNGRNAEESVDAGGLRRGDQLAERDRRQSILQAEGQKKSAILIAEGEKESAILRASAEKEAAILKAEAEKQAAILKADGEAQAIRSVQQALADSLEMLNEKAPSDSVLRLKAIEAMQKVADGQATKIIIPSEMQGLVGLANGIVEGTKQ